MQSQRVDQFNADIAKMVDAYQAVHRRPDPLEKFATAVSELHKPKARVMPEQPPRPARQRGQFPDGSAVPEGFKRAVFENYERLKAAYYGGEVQGAELPGRLVMNSAQPGVSPLIAELYGL